MKPNEDQKMLAREVARVFECRPSVTRFWNDDRTEYVDIVAAQDVPSTGVQSFATIGTYKTAVATTAKDELLSVEFVGACAAKFDYLDNVLATCSFNITQSGYGCYPGAIFRDVIQMYDDKTPMRHVLFVSPFLWEQNFESVKFGKQVVTWLQAVPISQAELAYAEEHGSEGLEDLFVEHQINVFDLKRESVI